jgi:outer membrane protein
MLLSKYKYLILVLIVVSQYHTVYAQDSTLIGKTIQWDLARCIDYAKKNNIQINTLHLSKLISDQEYLLARAARLPDLSASGSQNFVHAGGGSGFGANGSYGVNSNITLYNGNYINNNILQKNLSVQSANLSVIQQENDIILQVTQAYLAVLLDKETIIYNTDLLTTTQAQVKLEQQRYDVGSVARKDLIQLQAQQAADQYTLTNSKNLERGDLITLKQLLLLPTDVKFDIVKPDTITAINSISPFKDAEQTALQNRPEIKNGELGVKIAQYDVDKAAAGYKPSLVAGGSLGTGYTTGQGNFPNQFNNNFNQQIGVTLAVPIFTKRVVKTQVEEAKINVKQAELDLKDTRITLSQTVERAYINVQNAQSQYDAAAEQLKYSKEGYRIASEQLKVGVANTVDYLLQKNLFVQAQQQFVQAKYNSLLTLKIYDFYRGVPIKL